MKKLFLILWLLILTGCGKKEIIICTNNKKMNEINLNSKINVFIDSSRFKKLEIEVDIIVPEPLLNQKELIIKGVEEKYKKLGDKYNSTPVTTETDNGAKLTMEMTAEQAKEFSGSKNDKATRQDVIDIFGKQDFECK